MYHSYDMGHVFYFVCLQVPMKCHSMSLSSGFHISESFLHGSLKTRHAAYASSNASLGWNLDTATRPRRQFERTSLNLLECHYLLYFSIFLSGFIRFFLRHPEICSGIRFGFVWVNIHDGGFGYGCNHVVCHCTFYLFVQFLLQRRAGRKPLVR